MSRLSIYESSWLDLVFEGRNKEYGAYQLRRDSLKTTLFAFIVTLLCASIIAIVMLLSSFRADSTNNSEDILSTPVVLSKYPNLQPKKMVSTPVSKEKTPQKKQIEKQLIDPIIVKSGSAIDLLAIDKNVVVNNSATANSGGISTPTTTPFVDGSENGTTKTPSPTIPENMIVGTAAVDVMPEFPGGIKKFLTYVGNNFEKPEIEETVTILMAFVIEKDGSMTDIRVIRNPGYGLDKEAIRVLKAQKTKWKPGVKDGKAVRVLYTLPIKVTRGN